MLIDLGDRMIVKARYENNVLKPLGKLDLKEGKEVDIELKNKSLFDLLNGWKIDSQSLKDELREINGEIFWGYLRTNRALHARAEARTVPGEAMISE
jgi:predicted DNA-binding antitoxin AbrB/MazE fold protein